MGDFELKFAELVACKMGTDDVNGVRFVLFSNPGDENLQLLIPGLCPEMVHPKDWVSTVITVAKEVCAIASVVCPYIQQLPE